MDTESSKETCPPGAPAQSPAGQPVESRVERQLGLFGVFSVASGSMISSGLFVLPGLAFALAGPAAVVSYALAALLMLPVLLSKAELATAMPKSGGSYFYISRTLGPLAGAIAGFANWISIALKASFALVGLGALAAFVLPIPEEIGLRAGAVVACLVFTVLNLTSTRHTGRLQNLLVGALLLILVAYVVRGFAAVEETRYIPFAPHGWRQVFVVAGMVFVSYGGLTKVVDVSEEVRNPARNLALGMALAYAIVSALYIAVVFATVGLVPAAELAGSLVPIKLGAGPAMGTVGLRLVEVAAFLAFATTANAGILSASRSPMAMSRDGVLPPALSRTNRRFRTPHVAIAITSAFMVAVVAFLSVEDLVKTASSMMLFIFMLDNLCVIVMRRSGMQNYRPSFRVPFCPWLQIGAIIAYAFLIAGMGAVPLAFTAGFALLAAAWYFIYVWRRIEHESAFMHMVKAVVDHEMSRSGLEDELRGIVLERDNIVQDRFDKLVALAEVMDLEGAMPAQEFLKVLAERLAPRVGMEAADLYRRILERERQSPTVIRPGLAIPHVVVPGEGLFELALVRCREGIVFSEVHAPVTTAFVLIGSQDQRNYHLRALMHIAHIVQMEGFDGHWRDATCVEALRDLVLLAERPRTDHNEA